MTPEQRKELEDLTQRLRTRAAKVGTLSALWDVVFDNEAFLIGKPTIINESVEQRIEYAKQCLELGHYWKPADCEDWPDAIG